MNFNPTNFENFSGNGATSNGTGNSVNFYFSGIDHVNVFIYRNPGFNFGAEASGIPSQGFPQHQYHREEDLVPQAPLGSNNARLAQENYNGRQVSNALMSQVQLSASNGLSSQNLNEVVGQGQLAMLTPPSSQTELASFAASPFRAQGSGLGTPRGINTSTPNAAASSKGSSPVSAEGRDDIGNRSNDKAFTGIEILSTILLIIMIVYGWYHGFRYELNIMG